jgi:hypothetical protein
MGIELPEVNIPRRLYQYLLTLTADFLEHGCKTAEMAGRQSRKCSPNMLELPVNSWIWMSGY